MVHLSGQVTIFLHDNIPTCCCEEEAAMLPCLCKSLQKDRAINQVRPEVTLLSACRDKAEVLCGRRRLHEELDRGKMREAGDWRGGGELSGCIPLHLWGGQLGGKEIRG